MERPESLLEPWTNFYVIMGSAAAALTGLMFVVFTLIAGSERMPRSREATATFSTPTVVHFGAALFVAAILTAPWRVLIVPRLLLGVSGFCGIGYLLWIAYRIRRVSSYTADWEDWSWHTLLPLLSYALILLGALTLRAQPIVAPYGFAAAVVLMLFIGIHNAWDIVTFLAVERPENPGSGDPPDSAA